MLWRFRRRCRIPRGIDHSGRSAQPNVRHYVHGRNFRRLDLCGTDRCRQPRTESAAAVIETACGVDLTNEIGMDEPGATPSAGSGGIEVVSPVAETGTGTRENPIPVGQTAALGEDWELTVVSVEPDAKAAVMAESTFNDPPAPGRQFFMATVRVTYVGTASEEFYSGSLRVVGQSAVAYDSWDDSCGSIPDELADRELFPGGTIEGNLCWSVASADIDSLALYDSYQDSDERVFFSLAPGAGSGAAVASPAATEPPVKAAVSGRGFERGRAIRRRRRRSDARALCHRYRIRPGRADRGRGRSSRDRGGYEHRFHGAQLHRRGARYRCHDRTRRNGIRYHPGRNRPGRLCVRKRPRRLDGRRVGWDLDHRLREEELPGRRAGPPSPSGGRWPIAAAQGCPARRFGAGLGCSNMPGLFLDRARTVE